MSKLQLTNSTAEESFISINADFNKIPSSVKLQFGKFSEVTVQTRHNSSQTNQNTINRNLMKFPFSQVKIPQCHNPIQVQSSKIRKAQLTTSVK